MVKTYQKIMTGIIVAGVVCGVFGLILQYGIFLGVKANKTERGNQQCTVTQRVFDVADQLSDQEEEKLEKLIARKEKAIGADIVLVTINDDSIQSDSAMRDYAQNYYEENGFGWDQPNGDGLIYVDNWANGYTWMATTGKVAEKFQRDTIDFIIEKTNQKVNKHPYQAYKTLVNTSALQMQNLNVFQWNIRPIWVLVISIVGMLIFAGIELSGHGGRDTVVKSTYLGKNGVRMNEKRDLFLHSHISRVKIKSDNDHGGGGGSIGGSNGHGGGGGRH